MSHLLDRRVKIVEVGPRDGLQNEKLPVPLSAKVELIDQLSRAGLRFIEAASFVSPKWVPQMAGSTEVMASIERLPGVCYSALTPNLQGLEAALAARCDEVAVFGAASETFSQRNINCSIAQSLDRFGPVVQRAREAGVPVRGYVSCVLGCPYEGEVAAQAVLEVAQALLAMGCHEISLGDTIGRGSPESTRRLLEVCLRDIPAERLAGHFHDTYGMALANVRTSLEMGLRTFDSSVAGLGGCPYAEGASGNLATETLLADLHALGYETGVDMSGVQAAGHYIRQVLGDLQRQQAA
ncbi:hydroxymethylglutaryl-CoA lyase [Pandoraea vervacti]|uniref:hydroxymethylglutaryl-CoA lyase n=1 Tax=Pandoraea vervacti TaxID=656178 RepID=A0ABM5T1Z7_9BURK|nr:hydroxymethylglutaryl-CoA lyase [Pandoraea vervacti]AJP58897.1 hydroxymethylglutaryl-CoA lyase [Pandoraea vervacti]